MDDNIYVYHTPTWKGLIILSDGIRTQNISNVRRSYLGKEGTNVSLIEGDQACCHDRIKCFQKN